MRPFFVSGFYDNTNILVCQVLETRLTLQICLDAGEFLRVAVQRKFAIFVLGEIPQTAVRDLPRCLDRIADRDAPAGRTWCDDVNEFGTLDALGFFDLVQEGMSCTATISKRFFFGRRLP